MSDCSPEKQNNNINNLRIDQVPGGVQLAQSQFVMVLVVQHVHQIRIERMDIVQFREILDDLRQSVVEILLRVFDLSRVERTDARDLVAFVDNGGRLSLCLR